MDNQLELILEQLAKMDQKLDRVLLRLDHTDNSETQTDQWLNLEQLCAYLPDRPAKSTIYGLVRNRKIPFLKPNKSLIFSKFEIDEYIKSGKRKTLDECKAEAYLNMKKRK